MSDIRSSRRAFLAAVAVLASGCGSAKVVDPAVPDGEDVTPPPPRDTHERAAAIVNAKLRVLLHVGRVKDHPLAPKLVKMEAWGGLFEATGIDPLADVDRAFVAAANANDQRAVIAVAEHRVAEARLTAAIGKLVIDSAGDGEHLDGLGVPAAKVMIRGRKSVVLQATPSLLVVTSDGFAKAAAALASTGGLPEPDGGEAMKASAERPSENLKVRGAPRAPKTLSRADATVTMTPDKGADLLVEGQSTDPKQARADAAALTAAIDDATTVKISIVKIRAFEPIRFAPDGDRIVGKRHLTQGELGTLFDFAQMMAK
jgi:hypothetical protein